MASVGEHKNTNSQTFLRASPSISDSDSLSRDQTASLSTHSLPSLHIPWGGVPLAYKQHNEMDWRCAHCTTRPSSVLHLLGPGAVLLGDRLDALQHNSSFVRNNSWPKKVCSPYLYRGASSLRVPTEADTGSNEFVDLHSQSPLSRISHSPFQSISELQNGQHTRNSNYNTQHCFPSPKQLKRSSLNLQYNELIPTHHSASNISLDEISSRMHDRIQNSTPNLSNSPLLRAKAGRRLEGVDGQKFKGRMSSIESWFNEFSDVQRNVVLKKLFPLFTHAQIQLLVTTMEPFIDPFCMHNCQGILIWLPRDISLKILAYLDPLSLSQCGRVCRSWCHLVGSPDLWLNLCLLEKWQFSPAEEKSLSVTFLNSQKQVDWHRQFKERYRLKRNWRKGRFSVRTFSTQNSQLQEEAVSCIQFDEARIVSGSTNTIKVWDMRTNSELACFTLLGHSGVVRCLHLFGSRLISGASDKTIRIWDLTSNREWSKATCRKTLTGHSHTVRCLDADSSSMVSGSYDTSLKVWSIPEEKCLQTLRGHQEAVLCVKFNQERIVSGSKDCSIRIWDWSGRCLHVLHGHQGAVTCLHFDRKRVISGSLDSHLKIWDMSSLQCIRTVDWISSEGHRGVIRHLQADNWKIVSAADDRTLKVWNLEGERILTLHGHTDGVTCLHFNDRMIVSGSYDKTIRLWDFSAC